MAGQLYLKHFHTQNKSTEDSRLSNKEKSEMVKKNMSKLICCKMCISESRNSMALDSIERASRHDPDAVIVNKFEDRAYNRVQYTLVSFIINDGLPTTFFSPLACRAGSSHLGKRSFGVGSGERQLCRCV